MKLSEMKIPKKAGLAQLEIDSKRLLPYRKNDLIVLPDKQEAKFSPLQQGRQFLLRLAENPFLSLSPYYSYWFGGTDERPFLVQLNQQPFNKFIKEGEKGFYEALKPSIVRAFEKKLNVQVRRQGDIFAMPLLCCREGLSCFCRVLSSIILQLRPKIVKSKRLFGTRHRITGLFYPYPSTDFGPVIDPVIGEGVIEAPDHAPMELKGLHVLSQTSNLYYPQLAD